MSDLCKELDAFIDGELDPALAENCRHHLAHCAACEAKLRESLHLEVLATSALATPAQVPPAQARPRRWPTTMMTACAALAASVLVLVLRPASSTSEAGEQWLGHEPERRLEARVSYRLADQHRPYVPLRSGGAHPQVLPMSQMASLEEQGEQRGLVAAYILYGDLTRAAALLERQPASPDRDSDRAVIALQQGATEEAYELVTRALAAQPTHPQALWNRGLVLRELGLMPQAEEAFARVAALGEPGWSEEARNLVTHLRQQRGDRATARKAAVAAFLERLTREDTQLPLTEARLQPEPLRSALYEAVRRATSRQQLLALRPLAQELDLLEESTLLQGYIDNIAAHDFGRRAPLARAYALLLQNRHPSPAELHNQLRAAGERDLLLGALLHTQELDVDVDELAALAREAKDPRFELQVERARARQEAAAGRPLDAERRLIAALHACRARLPLAACTIED